VTPTIKVKCYSNFFLYFYAIIQSFDQFSDYIAINFTLFPMYQYMIDLWLNCRLFLSLFLHWWNKILPKKLVV